MHKESHQHIDVVDMLRPVTKFNARLNSARVIPEVVRKAFKVAQAQKPGPTHIELPEDVMAASVDADPLPVRTARRRPEPSGEELLHVARRLEQEVENRTAYTIDTAELNIYETQHVAEKVELTFTNPVLASMIRGKKVMHLPGTPSFDLLPGESVIVPSEETTLPLPSDT